MNEILWKQYREHCKARIGLCIERAVLEKLRDQRKGGTPMEEQDIKISDIHIHIVPGVDDGSQNTNMTWAMLDSLHKQNALGIIATPHSTAFTHDPEAVRQNYLKTCGILQDFFPQIRIALGCEVFCDIERMDTVIANLSSGKFPSLNNTRYVLTEFSPWIRPEYMLPCVETLLEHGWIPVIAHIERYDNLLANTTFLTKLREMGCLLQLNVSNLDPIQDNLYGKWAKILIEHEMIDFLSSDAHDNHMRPPHYSRALPYLRSTCSADYLEKILWKNAEELLWKGKPRWEE